MCCVDVSMCWCRCIGVDVLVSMYYCRCVGVDVLVSMYYCRGVVVVSRYEVYESKYTRIN